MKALQHAAGLVAVIAVILVLGVTAIDIAAYSDYSYYEREYARLGVLNDVPMQMEDLMEVTREMMAYLRGNRDDLVIYAPIDGESVEFFNEQEYFHMSEVRRLFLGGIWIRRISLAAAILCLVYLFLSGRNEQHDGKPSLISRIFPVYFQWGSIIFLVIGIVISSLFASDFTRYFTLFHRIFFHNDQWLFDPAVSRLINIVPEPFWSSIALRCALFFVGLWALVFVGCIIWRILARKAPGPRPASALAFLLAAALIAGTAQPASAAGVFDALHDLPASVPSAAANNLPVLTDRSGTPDWPSVPELECESAILIEPKTGSILMGKNIDGTYFPASITKLMTALLVLENCDLNDTVTFSYRATHELESGSTHIARTEDEQMSVRDCMYALLLASANEVAQALAEHVGGSIEHFADMMNERAVQLGCTHTHFANPSGLNNDNHYTSAHDMALIMRACIQMPEFLEIESANSYTIPPTNKNEESLTIAQKHKLVKQGEDHYDGALAGKTGYTSIAGNTLVTYAVRGDTELITVVMKSYGTHYDDTRAMLNYGFDNFSMIHLKDAETPSRLESESVTIPSGAVIPDSEWLVLPGDLHFAELDTRVEGLNGIADENGNRPVGRIIYSHEGADLGSATLMVPVSALTTTQAAETSEVKETAEDGAEPSGSPLRTGFQNVRNTLKDLKTVPAKSGEGIIHGIAFLLDHWLLGILVLALVVLLLLFLITRSRSSGSRRKRNSRYSYSSSAKHRRKRGSSNRYKMKL